MFLIALICIFMEVIFSLHSYLHLYILRTTNRQIALSSHLSGSLIDSSAAQLRARIKTEIGSRIQRNETASFSVAGSPGCYCVLVTGKMLSQKLLPWVQPSPAQAILHKTWSKVVHDQDNNGYLVSLHLNNVNINGILR